MAFFIPLGKHLKNYLQCANRLLFILVVLLMIPPQKGQDLDDFRWKNRLILLKESAGIL